MAETSQTSGSEKPVRCLVLLKRQPDMTQEEFNDYWLTVHGELAKAYPHVIRYSQLHLLEARSDTSPGESIDFGVDGIVDFLFEEGHGLFDLEKSEAGRVGMADAPKFLHAVQEIYVTEHHLVDKTERT
jgi:EthD domain